MAKGSVRKKGKKWYYRFYVENESGNLVQKEYVGTESKSETEKLLRKAMEEYESRRFLARAENITLGAMLDIWVNEELKPGSLSNGTVTAYQGVVDRIKQSPLGKRKLKTITADHLQTFIDRLSFGWTDVNGQTTAPLSKGYIRLYVAVLQHSFRFAVFPKRLVSSNPMQYVVLRSTKEEMQLFTNEGNEKKTSPTITHQQYLQITDFLRKEKSPALLPIQVAYYTGLRIGEVCGLTWQDINLEEQYLIVRRSMGYNRTRHKTEIGATKRNKIRIVDFCDTLTEILRQAKEEQHRQRIQFKGIYKKNYYVRVMEENRIYYETHTLAETEKPPKEYKEISFVCIQQKGAYESPCSVSMMCRTIAKKITGLEDFHFHMLRHTYTSNLLSVGAAPKDVQELLGHSNLNTTMNIYAHATRNAKRTSAKLLDLVTGDE